MKIVFLSDVHNKIAQMTIPDADVLVVTGDWTMEGTIKEIAKFNADLGRIKSIGGYKHVVVIGGNHDLDAADDYYQTKSLLNNAIYLEDEPLKFLGYNWYGSPWTPYCGMWAWQLMNPDMAMRAWSKIPENTEILLTHTPPYGILDTEPCGYKLAMDSNWPSLGDVFLRDKLEHLHELKIHAFGHIHGGHGYLEKDGVKYVNGAALERDYKTHQTPIVIELEDRNAAA